MLGRSWADLVFHVLAHAAGTRNLPASVYDPVYVAFCERSLGPAEERTLAEDALALSKLATSHQELARVGLVAWLFDTVERARSVATRELETLEPSDVDHPEILPALRRAPAQVELLRCAAELERPFFDKLPGVAFDEAELARALRRVTAAAPELARADVRVVRSLRLRGRVRGVEIWVGAPEPALGLAHPHVAWQAAHEASVAEVARQAPELEEREVEHVAVVLLAERAARAEMAAEHGRWLSHFGDNAPPIDCPSLSIAARNALTRFK